MHATGEDDETEGMMGDPDKSPTVGPFLDGSIRSGSIDGGRKTLGMMADKKLLAGLLSAISPPKLPLSTHNLSTSMRLS